ncbi:MAG: hypothetical protein HXL27_06210 [Prevotellaceae bacterium]|nr:hypothetical protein [Prevotellaceae bacterium]
MKVYISPSLQKVQLNAEPVMGNLSIDTNFKVKNHSQFLTQEEDFSSPIWGDDDSADESYNTFDEFVDF